MALKFPPRIDATPDQIAHVVLNAGRPKGPVWARKCRCVDCGGSQLSRNAVQRRKVRKLRLRGSLNKQTDCPS